MIVKTAQQGTSAEFELDSAIQGTMLYETMKQVHIVYGHLTAALHEHADREAKDASEDPARRHHTEVKSLEMLSTALKNAGRQLSKLGAQVDVLKGADIIDTFIDRTKLGPEIRGASAVPRVYIKNDLTDTVPTHVFEESSGLLIFVGRTGEEDDQAFVTIGTDKLVPSLCYGDDNAEPKIMVSINDLDIFDDAGHGNAKQAPIDKEDN
jgi:hypothetical protein